MITEPSGRPKGYGYVEVSPPFRPRCPRAQRSCSSRTETHCSLRSIVRAGTFKAARSVSASPSPVRLFDAGARDPNAHPTAAAKDREPQRTDGAWRREGPLPALDDRRRPSGGGFSSRDSVPDVDRGERMGFGSKFVPSSDDGARGFRRPPGSGERSASGFGFGARDGPDEDRGERMGFGSKFVPSASGPERSDRDPPRRGSNFVPSGDRPGFGDRRSSDALPGMADSASSWRSSRPAGNGSASRESPFLSRWCPILNTHIAAADSPVQRRKLELTARSVSSSTIAEESLPSPTTKPSPFGNARPIDSAERERAIEARMSKDREERAAKAEAEKAEREKSKQAADEARKSARASAPNPFGAAKPVDTLTRELEVEDKLAKERKERAERTQKPGPGGSGTAWGPTRRTSTATSSAGSKATPSPGPASPKANGSSTHLAASPSVGSEEALKSPPPMSTSSLRKEGVSFAALARGGSGPAASPKDVDEAANKVEGLALSSA